MAKPRKIILVSDGSKKFGPEAFEAIRTVLAPEVGGNVNLAVKLAAEHFAPRTPSSVAVTELEVVIPAITARFTAEMARKPANDGRLPLNDESQKLWDSGRWRGQLTVRGLAEKYAAEIKDGVDLTVSMIEAYAAELAAEKAVIVALVDERPDPDSGPVMCGSPVHRGEEREFQPTASFKLTRVDGALVRRKHDQGDEFIVVGNFLIVTDDEGKSTTVPYCGVCRGAAQEAARNATDEAGNLAPIKTTWYTVAGAQRKLDAAKRNAEGQSALLGQLRSAGARAFGGGYGTRKLQDWRRTRGARK